MKQIKIQIPDNCELKQDIPLSKKRNSLMKIWQENYFTIKADIILMIGVIYMLIVHLAM